MGKIFVVAEHRRGALRDITAEMLKKGRELADQSGNSLTAVLMGKNMDSFTPQIAPSVDEVLVVEDDRLENFNGEICTQVLGSLLDEHKPVLTLIGHTAAGLELAPGLAAAKNLPISTDCIEVRLEGTKLAAVRSVYGGKVNAGISFKSSDRYILTIRPGTFTPNGNGKGAGVVTKVPCPSITNDKKKFIEYIDAVAGAVDITLADVLVSVGQGLGDIKHIPMMEDFAASLGASLSCSRPVVDRKWLPQERQVGSSGKTVKPKVYFAIGISGAFQHVTAIKADIIIAINKDPRAPIFRVADYGFVGDLFQVLPKVKEKVMALRSK
jgi:electron transfer flavoprotein alpha subunit